ATTPSRGPATSGAGTDAKAPARERRAPWTSRARRSRPKASAPRGKAQLGPAIRSCGTMRSGLGSGSRFAAAAMTTNAPTIRRPARAARFRTSAAVTRESAPAPGGVRASARVPLPASSAQADSWIEPAIEKVDDGIGRDEQDGDDEHRALDEGVVALVDGGEQHPSESRDREDLLDDDGAAKEVPDLHAEDGDDDDEAVPECVVAHDGGGGKPLRVRGPDVVGAEDVEHGRARGPHDDGRHGEAEGHGGEEEEAEVGPGILGKTDVAAGVRHPPEIARQE